MDKLTIDQDDTDKTYHHPAIRARHIALTIVLMLASSYATYAWQHNKVAAANNNLSSTKQKVDFLNQQQDGLSKQISTLSDKNDQLSLTNQDTTPIVKAAQLANDDATTATLTVQVVAAHKYNNESNKRAVAVDVSVTNNTKEMLNFQISDFKFVDEHMNTSFDYGTDVGKTMSNGNVVLHSRTVAPGETFKGSLIFSTLDVPAGTFTLGYNSQSFSVTLQ